MIGMVFAGGLLTPRSAEQFCAGGGWRPQGHRAPESGWVQEDLGSRPYHWLRADYVLPSLHWVLRDKALSLVACGLCSSFCLRCHWRRGVEAPSHSS